MPRWKPIKVDDLKLPFVEKLFRVLNHTAPGLEFAILYNIILKYASCICGGVGVIFVDEMGGGKGRTTRSTFELLDFIDGSKYGNKWDEDGIIRWGVNNNLRNKRVDFLMEDMTGIISSKYKMQTNLNSICGVISDRRIGATTIKTIPAFEQEEKKEKYSDIQFLSSSFSGGCVPDVLFVIKRMREFRAMYGDRFKVYFLLMSKEQFEYLQRKINFNWSGIKRISNEELRDLIKKLVIPNAPPLDHPLPLLLKDQTYVQAQNVSIDMFDLLYTNRQSYNRGSQYFEAELSALAYLNNLCSFEPTDKPFVSDQEISFFRLFYPNLYLYSVRQPLVQQIAQHCLIFPNIHELARMFQVPWFELKTAYFQEARENKKGNPVVLSHGYFKLKEDLRTMIKLQNQYIMRVCHEG